MYFRKQGLLSEFRGKVSIVKIEGKEKVDANGKSAAKMDPGRPN